METPTVARIAAVYTDGGCFKSNPSPEGGSWAYCYVDEKGLIVGHGRDIVLPKEIGMDKVSNNVTELLGIIHALEGLPEGWSGTVYSDSLCSITRAESPRIARFNGAHFARQRLTDAVDRLGELKFVLLGGHPSRGELAAGRRKDGKPVSRFNCLVDDLCRRTLEHAAEQAKSEGQPGLARPDHWPVLLTVLSWWESFGHPLPNDPAS